MEAAKKFKKDTPTSSLYTAVLNLTEKLINIINKFLTKTNSFCCLCSEIDAILDATFMYMIVVLILSFCLENNNHYILTLSE